MRPPALQVSRDIEHPLHRVEHPVRMRPPVLQVCRDSNRAAANPLRGRQTQLNVDNRAAASPLRGRHTQLNENNRAAANLLRESNPLRGIKAEPAAKNQDGQIPPPLLRDVTPPRSEQSQFPQYTYSMPERRRVESRLFAERDGKALGRTIKELIPWHRVSHFATAPSAAGEKERVFYHFQNWRRGRVGTPDQLAVQYVWSKLGTVAPSTAISYLCRIVLRAHELGERGYRTRFLAGAKALLRRSSTMIRPVQATPLQPAEAQKTLRRLADKGQGRAAALFAIAWVARARVSDIRYVTSQDWVEQQKDLPADATEVHVFAKEKACKTWQPSIFLPAGRTTAVAVAFMRTQTGARDDLVFGGDTDRYVRLKAQIRTAMGTHHWLHSIRRGSIQEVESRGVEAHELQKLLRHADPRTTTRYLRTNTEHRRRVETAMTHTLQ